MTGLDPILRELRGASVPLLHLDREVGSPGSVALVSGSFDPPTIAHVALADAAAARAELVLLVYSVRTLPKEEAAGEPLLEEPTPLLALQRVASRGKRTEVALASHGLLADQVAAARAVFPAADLYVVIGSDKLLQLLDPMWYPDRAAALGALFAAARVLYALREGDGPAVAAALRDPSNAAWLRRLERLDVPNHVAAVSSRLVRRLLRRSEDVRHLVPDEVLDLLPRPRDPAGDLE